MKIKVKIPVVITADGKWAAGGSHHPGNIDWEFIEEGCDFDAPLVSPQRYFVEAELEVPEVRTVSGEVVADQ